MNAGRLVGRAFAEPARPQRLPGCLSGASLLMRPRAPDLERRCDARRGPDLGCAGHREPGPWRRPMSAEGPRAARTLRNLRDGTHPRRRRWRGHGRRDRAAHGRPTASQRPASRRSRTSPVTSFWVSAHEGLQRAHERRVPEAVVDELRRSRISMRCFSRATSRSSVMPSRSWCASTSASDAGHS